MSRDTNDKKPDRWLAKRKSEFAPFAERQNGALVEAGCRAQLLRCVVGWPD